jgi:type I restriction enzyme R subunit
LVYGHIGEVTIEGAGIESIAIDAGVFETLRQMKLLPDPGPGVGSTPPTVEDVLDTLEKRLQAKLHGHHSHPVWISLSEQLEALRKERIDSALASVEFLKRLLQLARELVGAEKASEVGELDDIEVVDPHLGALTQILREYAPPDTPAVIEVVVEQIDSIVRPVRGTGWQTSHPGDREVRRQLRDILRRNALPPIGELFDRAYAYIREHY